MFPISVIQFQRYSGLLATALVVGCSSSPTGPESNNPSPNASVVTLVAVSPAGGATAVSPGTMLTMRFSGPMMAGMEQYVDLHDGSMAGPVHPMTCSWSADRTTLTCQPATPLQDGATYTLHIGAGMMSAAGGHVDDSPGLEMGGAWMMDGMHAGQPMTMMSGGDWRGSNGSYGMAFTFQTS